MFQLLSKEDYLNSRRDWKEEYRDISSDIHALKVAQKEAAKGGWSAANRLQSLRARMSNEAHQMMDELEVLKENSRLSVAFERFMDKQNFF